MTFVLIRVSFPTANFRVVQDGGNLIEAFEAEQDVNSEDDTAELGVEVGKEEVATTNHQLFLTFRYAPQSPAVFTRMLTQRRLRLHLTVPRCARLIMQTSSRGTLAPE